MAFPQGLNFRATSGYVTDQANEAAETGTTANYPRTTAQGNTVGWEQATNANRDRNASNDRRLAGINSITSATARDYRIDLPATGDYAIRAAIGDASFPQSAQHVEFFDGSTSLGVVCNGASVANQFFDASGVQLTAANWPSSNAAVTKTFASTIFRTRLTWTAQSTTLAHLYIESAAGGSTYDESASDTSKGSDASATELVAGGAVSDTGKAQDSVATDLTAGESVSDTAKAADTAAGGSDQDAAIADTAKGSDAAAPDLAAEAAASDTGKGADAAAAQLDAGGSVSDTGKGGDAPGSDLAAGAAISDTAKANDSTVIAGADYDVAASDTAKGGDAAAAQLDAAGQAAETAKGGDAAATQLDAGETAGDAAKGADTPIGVAAIDVAASDTALAGDAAGGEIFVPPAVCVREVCLAAIAELLADLATAQAFGFKRLPHKAPRGSEAPMIVMYDGREIPEGEDPGNRYFGMEIAVEILLRPGTPLGGQASDVVARIRDAIDADPLLGGRASELTADNAAPPEPAMVGTAAAPGAAAYAAAGVRLGLRYATTRGSAYIQGAS